MARIITTVGDVRGAVGGLVLQRSRSGTIIRRRSPGNHKLANVSGSASGSDPGFPSGQAKNHLASLNYYWSLLTGAQQQAWTAFGIQTRPELGSPSRNTGRLTYIAVNMWRLANILSRLDAAPAPPPAFPSPRITAVTLVGGQLRIAFTPTPLGANFAFCVRSSGVPIGARTYKLARARHIGTTGTNPASPATRFANTGAQVGQQAVVWVAVCHPASGRQGEYLRFAVTAT